MWHKKTKQNKTQLTNLNLGSGFPWHQTSGWKVKNLVDVFKYPNIVSVKQLNDWIFPFLSEYLCFKYVEPSVLSSRKHYKFQKQCLTDRGVLSTYYVGLTLAKCVSSWPLSSNDLQCNKGSNTSTQIYIKNSVEQIKTQERRRESTVKFLGRVTTSGWRGFSSGFSVWTGRDGHTRIMEMERNVVKCTLLRQLGILLK